MCGQKSSCILIVKSEIPFLLKPLPCFELMCEPGQGFCWPNSSPCLSSSSFSHMAKIGHAKLCKGLMIFIRVKFSQYLLKSAWDKKLRLMAYLVCCWDGRGHHPLLLVFISFLSSPVPLFDLYFLTYLVIFLCHFEIGSLSFCQASVKIGTLYWAVNKKGPDEHHIVEPRIFFWLKVQVF